MKSKEVKSLKVGDVLAFTYVTIVTTPTMIENNKYGKLQFVVKHKDGSFEQKSWNRHQLINVIC